MAWTSPRTWIAGETVTASLLNTHLRDNLLETAPAKVTAAGDIVYATGANALARLAKGSAHSLLRMNSGATAPLWAATTAVVESWEYSNDSDGNTTQTSFQNAYTKSFTPSVASRVLVWIQVRGQAPSNDSMECKVLVDDTQRGELKGVGNGSQDWVWLFLLTGQAASSHTIKVQYRSVGGNSVSLLNCQMLIIALAE